MKDLIIGIFGAYEPVMSQAVAPSTVDGVTTYDVIDVVASGAAGVDWAWIMGVLLFALVLYSMFRILGVFFR